MYFLTVGLYGAVANKPNNKVFGMKPHNYEMSTRAADILEAILITENRWNSGSIPAPLPRAPSLIRPPRYAAQACNKLQL